MDDIFSSVKTNFFLLREALQAQDLDKVSTSNLELSHALTVAMSYVFGENPLEADDALFNELDVYMREYFELSKEVLEFTSRWIDKLEADICTKELLQKFNLDK